MSHGTRHQIYTARKSHMCLLCGRRIPVGHRYWSKIMYVIEDGKESIDRVERQHTNCELYTKEPYGK